MPALLPRKVGADGTDPSHWKSNPAYWQSGSRLTPQRVTAVTNLLATEPDANQFELITLTDAEYRAAHDLVFPKPPTTELDADRQAMTLFRSLIMTEPQRFRTSLVSFGLTVDQATRVVRYMRGS